MMRHNRRMRTTVDLEDRALKVAKAIAHKRQVSLGKVVSEAILDRYCAPETSETVLGTSAAGFPTFSTGRPITADEVKEFLENSDFPY